MKNLLKQLIKPFSVLALIAIFFLPALEKSLMYWKLSSAYYRIKNEISHFKTESVLKSEGFVVKFTTGDNEQFNVYSLVNQGLCGEESIGSIIKSFSLTSSSSVKFTIQSSKDVIFCFFPNKAAETSDSSDTLFSLKILNESFFRDNTPDDIRFKIDLQNFDLSS